MIIPMDDNDGQMIFGDLGGLKLADICLTGEAKPRKNLIPFNWQIDNCEFRNLSTTSCTYVLHFEVLGPVNISGHWRPYWMMIDDDNDGQMIFGDLGGLKLPDICLIGEEKPRQEPHPGNLSRPGIEPEPAAWQARMLPPSVLKK